MSTLKRRSLKRNGNNTNSTVLPDDDVQGKFRQLESPYFFNYENSQQQQQQSSSPNLSPTKDTAIIQNHNNGDLSRLVNFNPFHFEQFIIINI